MAIVMVRREYDRWNHASDASLVLMSVFVFGGGATSTDDSEGQMENVTPFFRLAGAKNSLDVTREIKLV